MGKQKGKQGDLPFLPYKGSSGHSGSDTSKERAQRRDSNGQTAGLQGRVLTLLAFHRFDGITVKELRERTTEHHGSCSGALSNLHKAGAIRRLKDRRDRCKIYVLPPFVGSRVIEPFGGKK